MTYVDRLGTELTALAGAPFVWLLLVLAVGACIAARR